MTFPEEGAETQRPHGEMVIGLPAVPVRRRPKISEPVLNSVIPAKAGTQVA
jgi:hypothetical protein